MVKTKTKDYGKYFFILLLVVMIILVFFIIKPFITAILTSGVIAYVFYPLYKFLHKRLKNRHLAALLIVVLVILVITIPLYFTLNAVSKEARINYLLLKQKIISGNIFGVDCDVSDIALCRVSNYIEDVLKDPHTRYYIETGAQRITEYIINSASHFLLSLPLTILNFFIMVVLIFYLLIDGELLLSKFMGLFPLRKKHQLKLFKKFKEAIGAVVYGYIVIAVIEGIIAAIGFYLAGISAPILWGVVIALLALIPFIGPAFIWIPAFFIKLFLGANLQAIIVFVIGIILVFIDSLLKPKVIGDRARIHPVLILLGVVGGLMIFGFIGVVIGPVILTLLVTLLKIYKEEKIITIA